MAKYNWSTQAKEDDMIRACTKNGGEEEHMYVNGGKAKRKTATRKIKTYLGG
jgi:hypothetical protein